MGGGGKTHYQASNYDAGYNYGKTGGAFSFPENHPEYSYFKAGYDKAVAESKPKENPFAGMMEMMAGMMESMKAPKHSEEEVAEVVEPVDEYMEKYGVSEAQYKQDVSTRDSLFKEYMDSASSATTYITNEINKERANAQLLGIDYSITDEQKSARINDYFATMWGEGAQGQLDTLITKYGNPEGFDGTWLVKRGDGSTGQGAGTPEDTTLATSQTAGGGGTSTPTLVSEDEDEDTLG